MSPDTRSDDYGSGSPAAVSALTLVLAVAAMLAWALPASGHGLNVFAWDEGERVMVESKFSGGKRPVGAVVRVLAPDGRELLAGETDPQGRWSFERPAQTALTVVLEAGMGHRAEWVIEAAQTVGTTTAAAATAAAQAPAEAPPPEPTSRPAADLEAKLRGVVTEAVAPLSARLARLEEAHRRPGIRDILGGLGYILGLVGVGAYLQARRLRERHGGVAASGQAP